jgi:hypothetical protein
MSVAPLLPCDTHLQSSSSSSSPTSARRNRKSSRSKAVVTLFVIILLYGVYRIISSQTSSSLRYSHRSSQTLRGFSNERITKLGIPSDLLEYLPPEELLNHPLLATIAPLDCQLTPFHQNRYSPLFPEFHSQRSGNQRDLVIKLNYLIGINLIDAAAVFPSLIRAMHSLMIMTGGQNGARRRFHISIVSSWHKTTFFPYPPPITLLKLPNDFIRRRTTVRKWIYRSNSITALSVLKAA